MDIPQPFDQRAATSCWFDVADARSLPRSNRFQQSQHEWRLALSSDHRTTLLATLWIGAILCSVSIAHAQTRVLFVDGDDGLAVPIGPNPGESWSDAYQFLNDAIDRGRFLVDFFPEVDQVEIWVASTETTSGYRPDQTGSSPAGSFDPDETFRIADRVHIFGGFVGGEAELNQRDPETNETVLTAALGDCNGAPCSLSYSVVEAILITEGTRLDGVTILGGSSVRTDLPVDGTQQFGGGLVLAVAENVDVRRTSFRANRSVAGGGAVALIAGAPGVESDISLTNCRFLNNRIVDALEGGGGAVYVGPLNSAKIINSVFERNFYDLDSTGLAQRGGAIHNGGMMSLLSTTFSGNVAGANGGALYVDAKSPGVPPDEIVNCIFWGNEDEGGLDETAQVFAEDTSDVLVSSTCIQGLSTYIGSANIGADPLFVDVAAGDLRLSAASPCRDAGDNLAVDAGFDVDDDGTLDDLLLSDRIRVAIVDMGAYEFRCTSDIDDNGEVDVDDLLDLLASWGPCTACASDLNGDGNVGTPDLLILLADWGCGNPAAPGAPQGVVDCISRYGSDPVKLEGCIEGMILSGTP